ncbi:unnamed protein product [Trichobilharzia szidati]|nr:unnamed protein product [Trichobilharzia szidati]
MITVIGLALVGSKSVFSVHSVKSSVTQSAIGLVLVLAGTFTSAAQMIVEEVFLKSRGFHPLQAVGMEGIFGCILMCAIVLPAVHYIPGNDLNGSYENVIDAVYQIGSNYVLLGNCILYVLSIAFFNYCGLSITRSLSSVHRTLIDSLRTAFVWICSLILYYAVGPPYGEPFTVGWGLIEIDGFALLIIGTLVHNRVLDITCCCPHRPEPVILTPRQLRGMSESSEPYSLDYTDTMDSSDDIDVDDVDDDEDDDEDPIFYNDRSGGGAGSMSSSVLSTAVHRQQHDRDEQSQQASLLLLKTSIVGGKSINYSTMN